MGHLDHRGPVGGRDLVDEHCESMYRYGGFRIGTRNSL